MIERDEIKHAIPPLIYCPHHDAHDDYDEELEIMVAWYYHLREQKRELIKEARTQELQRLFEEVGKMGDERITPSDYFGDCEQAISTVCQGCPDERGWADGEGDGDACCEGMISIMDDRDDIIIKRGNKYACALRIERAEKREQAELDKYNRRMRGDWS